MYALPASDERGCAACTIGRYVRMPARKERERAPFFAGYTEGIINICYSTYSARAAPFYPTMWLTGRTLNTLSPSLYMQAVRTHVHTCTEIVVSHCSRSTVNENFYLRSPLAPTFVGDLTIFPSRVANWISREQNLFSPPPLSNSIRLKWNIHFIRLLNKETWIIDRFYFERKMAGRMKISPSEKSLVLPISLLHRPRHRSTSRTRRSSTVSMDF